MEIVALIISILALILSIFQFIRDASWQKKEATLNAYNRLQDDAFSHLNKYSSEFLNSTPEYRSDEYNDITDCLVKIELFSTGINSGIYSIWVLNRLGGAYYIHQFKRLNKIIEKKREENRSQGRHYDEFEKTVKKLERIRRLGI